MNVNNDKPVAIVENLTLVLPSKYAILSGSYSKNAESFEWAPPDDVPAQMVNDFLLG
jgi:hypothetical protein